MLVRSSSALAFGLVVPIPTFPCARTALGSALMVAMKSTAKRLNPKNWVSVNRRNEEAFLTDRKNRKNYTIPPARVYGNEDRINDRMIEGSLFAESFRSFPPSHGQKHAFRERRRCQIKPTGLPSDELGTYYRKIKSAFVSCSLVPTTGTNRKPKLRFILRKIDLLWPFAYFTVRSCAQKFGGISKPVTSL